MGHRHRLFCHHRCHIHADVRALSCTRVLHCWSSASWAGTRYRVEYASPRLVLRHDGLAITAAGPVYIGEMAPSHIRGYIMAFWQLFYSVGSFIAYWINYACAKRRQSLGEWDWKMVVIFQMLVPTLIIVLLPWQPETPRWHIQRHGDVDAAKASLRKVRDTEEEVEAEVIAIREAIEYEKEISGVGYKTLFKEPSIRKRLLLAFILVSTPENQLWKEMEPALTLYVAEYWSATHWSGHPQLL